MTTNAELRSMACSMFIAIHQLFPPALMFISRTRDPDPLLQPGHTQQTRPLPVRSVLTPPVTEASHDVVRDQIHPRDVHHQADGGEDDLRVPVRHPQKGQVYEHGHEDGDASEDLGRPERGKLVGVEEENEDCTSVSAF